MALNKKGNSQIMLTSLYCFRLNEVLKTGRLTSKEENQLKKPL